MNLIFEVPNSPVTQGATVSLRVLADLDSDVLAAWHLQVRLPPAVLNGLTAVGDASAGGVFNVDRASNGIVTLVGLPARPLTGLATLVTFTAQMGGFRGAGYSLSAELLSASDPDLLPLFADGVEASLVIESGSLGVATAVLAKAHRDEHYASMLLAEGGRPPYKFSLAAGALPAGLTLELDSGFLSGTPSQQGIVHPTFRVEDSAGATANRVLLLEVTSTPPRISTDKLPPTAPGHRYRAVLGSDGGTAPLHWTVVGLAPGLTVRGRYITGTVDPTAPLGTNTVTLLLRDSSVPPQQHQVELPLSVLPIAATQRLSASAPEAIVAARDLYVAEYTVELNGSAFDTYQDPETDAILDRALDELMTAIFEEMANQDPVHTKPNDPRGPRGFEPGDPFEPDLPRRPGGLSDRLTALLHDYRWLDKERHPVVASYGLAIAVLIDGEQAYTWSNIDIGNHVRTRAAGKSMRPAARAQRLSKELRAKGGSWIKFARQAVQSAMRKGNRKIAKKRLAWNGDARLYFDKRLQDLLELVGSQDWTIWRKPAPAKIRLTPGNHTVRLVPTVLMNSAGNTVSGAVAVATAVASMSATFRAVNPNDWPRLRGTVSFSGNCGIRDFIEANVEFPNSGVDVAFVSGGLIQILPDTGAGWGSPEPFSVNLGIRPKHLSADRMDPIGRTWLVAANDDQIRMARNKGVGGFAMLDAPDLPVGSSIKALQVLKGSGFGYVAALLSRAVAVLTDFGEATVVIPQRPRLVVLDQAISSGITHDVAAAFRVCEEGGGQILVADKFSGEVMVSPLKLDPPHVGARPVNSEELRGVNPYRAPVAIVLDQSLATPLGVVALGQQRRLQWFELVAAAAAPTGPASRQAGVDLVAPPVSLAAGPGRGLTILIGPAGQVLYWDTDSQKQFVVWVDGGVTQMTSVERVLAIALNAENQIVILEDRRPNA